MNLLPLFAGWNQVQYQTALRIMLTGVMSHGAETPALFAWYTDLLRAAKARPARWK